MLGHWLRVVQLAATHSPAARPSPVPLPPLTGIKAIKLYAWEQPYVERITKLR